jgi:hypothetical protein
MTRTGDWSAARLRLLVPLRRKGEEKLRARLETTLAEIRIAAEVETVSSFDRERLVERSRGSHLVFLPLRMVRDAVVDPFGASVAPLLEALPVVALVSATEDIELDAQPDEGGPAEAAHLADEVGAARGALGKLRKELRAAQGRASKAGEGVRKAEADLAGLDASREGAEQERLKRVQGLRTVREQEAEARKTVRKLEGDVKRAQSRRAAAERALAELEAHEGGGNAAVAATSRAAAASGADGGTDDGPPEEEQGRSADAEDGDGPSGPRGLGPVSGGGA